MSVMPVSAAAIAVPTTSVAPAATAADPNAGTTGAGFGNALMQALDGVQQTQTTDGQLSQLAATGNLTNVHDLTIATSEAELATQLTTAVRDKAVAAFNAIMSMPV